MHHLPLYQKAYYVEWKYMSSKEDQINQEEYHRAVCLSVSFSLAKGKYNVVSK